MWLAPRRALVASGAAFALAVAGACSSGGDDAAPGDRSPASTQRGGAGVDESQETSTTAAPVVDEEQAVLDAYRAAWDAFTLAFAMPTGPPPPAVDAALTADTLAIVLDERQILAESGQYTEGPIDLSPTVVALDGTEAIVQDCALDATVLYGTGGEVLNPADDAPNLFRAVMVQVDGAWKMSDLDDEGDCQP